MASFAWLFQPDYLFLEWLGNDSARFGLLDRLPILFTTAAIFGVAFLLGRIVLEALRLGGSLTRLETVVMATGVGTNLLSLVVLLLGLAGRLQSRLLFLLLGVVIAAVAAWRWKHWRACDTATIESEDRTPLASIALWCCLPFAILIMLGGMVPPIHFDVREYHLQIPKEWYQQGYIGFVPHNVYGNMPLGAEMHAVTGMAILKDWWLGAIVGKTAIAAFAPLTALALFCFGKRFLSTTAGAVAAAAYLSTPWTARVSMIGLIEGPYGFYILLAVYATMMAVRVDGAADEREKSIAKPSIAALAGFFAGAAVACKYPALLFVVAPLGLATTLLPRWRFHWRPAAAFALAVAVSCGPWLAKNIVLTGNPTYPLLYSMFGGETRTPEKDEQWTRAHQTPTGGLTASHAIDSVKLMTLTSQYLSPILIPLAAIGLFCRRRFEVNWSLAALVLYIFAAWWLLTHRVDRFLFPLLPLVAVLVGTGATMFTATIWRRVIAGLLIACCVLNFLFSSSRQISDNRILVAMSDLREDLPNPRDPPEPEVFRYTHINDTHRLINKIVKPGFRAMLVGEAQVFNLEVPIVYNTCFDDCVFEQAMTSCPPEERLQAFQGQRISHVFISWRELDRYRGPGNYGYSDYVTRDLIRREYVLTRVLREVPTGDPNISQLFEVTGWQDWPP